MEKVYVPKHPYRFDLGKLGGCTDAGEVGSCIGRREENIGWAAAARCSGAEGTGSINIKGNILLRD